MQSGKDLNVRYWCCQECRTKHDRDINASLNILEKGLELIINIKYNLLRVID